MQEVQDIPSPPARPDGGHKGTFGTVIVVGGCATMLGAPALCARAAFRGGAGLVKIACPSDPPELLLQVLAVEPGATGVRLPMDDVEAAAWALDQADPEGRAVLAVGPGMGPRKIEPGGDSADGLVMRLLMGRRSVVLDADGLNALASSLSDGDAQKIAASLRDAGPARANETGSDPATRGSDTTEPTPARILTPHPGEFRRLAEPLGITLDPTDPKQRLDAAAALAKALNAVVLLKGQHTVISDGERYATNTTGNPALATAGSGDVLTGLVAALLAQGMDAFDAAHLAAHVHGRAADQWAAKHGHAGLRAMDLADGIPDALHALR